jgi:hypothetical protein
MPHWGIYEATRRRAEKLKHPDQLEQVYVRLKAPAGIGSVQTFSGRHLNVGSDGTVEMSARRACKHAAHSTDSNSRAPPQHRNMPEQSAGWCRQRLPCGGPRVRIPVPFSVESAANLTFSIRGAPAPSALSRTWLAVGRRYIPGGLYTIFVP